MIEKQGKIENARWVEGDLGVHFVYTAGVAGEEFLRGLAKGKVLASTCDRCNTTYCPPRIFCEDCFEEIADRHEVAPEGEIVTLTRIHQDQNGKAREPEWVAAIQLEGTDTTLLHRVEGEGLGIGDRVEAVWASKRTGSILDIEHFKRSRTASAGAPRAAKAAQGNGRKKPSVRVAVGR